jgi:hypothetical protein
LYALDYSSVATSNSRCANFWLFRCSKFELATLRTEWTFFAEIIL